jgi:hypothetical protein
MKIVSVECPRCQRLNQIPGSDIELLDLPGGSFRCCFSCAAGLDFSRARLEDYQQDTPSVPAVPLAAMVARTTFGLRPPR